MKFYRLTDKKEWTCESPKYVYGEMILKSGQLINRKSINEVGKNYGDDTLYGVLTENLCTAKKLIYNAIKKEISQLNDEINKLTELANTIDITNKNGF